MEEFAVHHYFEDAALGRDERQVFDLVFELLDDALRQTDGSRCVASLGAVFDRDLHGGESSGGFGGACPVGDLLRLRLCLRLGR
jgi:hypothetical protein